MADSAQGATDARGPLTSGLSPGDGKRDDPGRGGRTCQSAEGSVYSLHECPLGTRWLPGPPDLVAQDGPVSADRGLEN